MKRILSSGAFALLFSLGLQAQDFKLVWEGADIPAEAAAIVEQRTAQMLEPDGFSLSSDEDAVPITVTARVSSRMESVGSMNQEALNVELSFSANGVSEVFSLRGVGADEADAWVRAAKQFLPRSKVAQGFVTRLKESFSEKK